jgi:hypothetical protein
MHMPDREVYEFKYFPFSGEPADEWGNQII